MRGLEAGTGPGAPEDWVGSTTTSFGHEHEGLSTLADGRVLRDVIAADPIGYLGEAHVERFGETSAMLVKLLDTAERFAVHFHPGREFARAALGSRLRQDRGVDHPATPSRERRCAWDCARRSTPQTLRRWVGEQDSASMLAALHPVPVARGDVLFVPAGTLHTIGAGITLIELQEPSDMSVVIEWRLRQASITATSTCDSVGTVCWWQPTPRRACLRTAPSAPTSAGASSVESLLPPEADAYFRAERLSIDGRELSLSAAVRDTDRPSTASSRCPRGITSRCALTLRRQPR